MNRELAAFFVALLVALAVLGCRAAPRTTDALATPSRVATATDSARPAAASGTGEATVTAVPRPTARGYPAMLHVVRLNPRAKADGAWVSH
ncbi:MAG: hypothetical protein KDD73_11825 [Anaerolineales bacterium]|nr:hypothetical protein [Anaerolineales bacterium]MCB9129225.1 hypothetical protein [Ardenticatenales bacterium]